MHEKMSRRMSALEGSAHSSRIEGKKAAPCAIADGLVVSINAAVDNDGVSSV